MEKLTGDYIAGFIDGEGCFALKFRRDVRRKRKNKPEYFYWSIEFAIVLRGDDKNILEKIKNTLDCGNISIDRRNQARYSVSSISDIVSKVVPFFEKYHLHAKKKFDFELWKEAVLILNKNKGKKTDIFSTRNTKGNRKIVWDNQDIQRLKKIHEQMKRYKSTGSEWKWIHKI